MPCPKYRRRDPEKSVLWRVVQQHLLTFLDRAREAGGLPAYVGRAFRKFFDCGILSKGFARVRCEQCGYDAAVAFS